MSARHRRPRPESDGVFAGLVLVAANVLGFGILAGQTLGADPVRAAVAPDAPPPEDHPDAGPVTAKKDSGPAAPPTPPRAAEPACYGAGCTTVPSRPESSSPAGTGRDHQTLPDSSANFRASAAPYEPGPGSFNSPRNAITAG